MGRGRLSFISISGRSFCTWVTVQTFHGLYLGLYQGWWTYLSIHYGLWTLSNYFLGPLFLSWWWKQKPKLVNIDTMQTKYVLPIYATFWTSTWNVSYHFIACSESNLWACSKMQYFLNCDLKSKCLDNNGILFGSSTQ